MFPSSLLLQGRGGGCIIAFKTKITEEVAKNSKLLTTSNISSEINLNSEDKVSSSLAVKTVYDKVVSVQNIATAASKLDVVELKGRKSATGDWTITDLKIGRPLYILLNITTDSTTVFCQIGKVKSGSENLLITSGCIQFGFANDASYDHSTNVAVFIPTSTELTVNISKGSNFELLAYQ